MVRAAEAAPGSAVLAGVTAAAAAAAAAVRIAQEVVRLGRHDVSHGAEHRVEARERPQPRRGRADEVAELGQAQRVRRELVVVVGDRPLAPSAGAL